MEVKDRRESQEKALYLDMNHGDRGSFLPITSSIGGILIIEKYNV